MENLLYAHRHHTTHRQHGLVLPIPIFVTRAAQIVSAEAKAVKAPPFYCESVTPGSRHLNDVIGHVLSFVGPWVLEGLLWVNRLFVHFVGCTDATQGCTANTLGVRSFICLGTRTTRSYRLRSGRSSPSKSRRTGFQKYTFKVTEHALLQAVTHFTQESGVVRPLERTIGGIVCYRAVEWAAYVDKQGMPPSTLPVHSPAPSETSKARSKDANVGRRLWKRTN